GSGAHRRRCGGAAEASRSRTRGGHRRQPQRPRFAHSCTGPSQDPDEIRRDRQGRHGGPWPIHARLGADRSCPDLTGLIDVDMFLDAAGRVSVIDINPRFGGGYPFVHLAGANVPLYYLAQALDLDIDQGWGRYDTDIVSAKYESIRVTAPSPRWRPCPSGHSDHRAR